MRAVATLLLLGAVACVDQVPTDEGGGGGGKADGNGTCTDPMYGDGTCHADLACGIPDIDCFQIFPTDEAAAATSIGFYQVLPTTDPHYAKARSQLDQSWELFKANTPLGKLADQRLAVAVVRDPTVNAFVYPAPTPGMAYFTVYINTGLLDSAMTLDEFHGIMFHELTHLQKLHTTPEVIERTHRYYAAPAGSEPIGATQIDHADVREAFDAWKGLAQFAGVFTTPDLAGLPYGGALHYLFQYYYYIEQSRAPQCSDPLNRLSHLFDEVGFSPLDQSPILTPEIKAAAPAAIAALKQCIASDALKFRELKAMVDPSQYGLTPADAALDDMRAFDALLALQADRRAKVAAAQAAFETKTGRPWSALRFFSTEEEADDHSAKLTKTTGVNETGVTGFLLANMTQAAATLRPQCESALAAGQVPPYGQYLIDDHHGDCWRIAHARQVAADSTRSRTIDVRAPEPWVPTRLSPPRPIY